jgi:hypothetical protein
MKRTTITPEQEPEHRNRKGFHSVCCYGAITPEKGEIGGIFKNVRNTRIEHGLFVHDAQCVERIFVTPNA